MTPRRAGSGADQRGLTHCGTLQAWMDLSYWISGGKWTWACGLCGEVLSVQPFAFPPDMPALT